MEQPAATHLNLPGLLSTVAYGTAYVVSRCAVSSLTIAGSNVQNP